MKPTARTTLPVVMVLIGVFGALALTGFLGAGGPAEEPSDQLPIETETPPQTDTQTDTQTPRPPYGERADMEVYNCSTGEREFVSGMDDHHAASLDDCANDPESTTRQR